MRALCVSAALLVIGGAAQAGQSFSFDIDGRTIRIERPADCAELSCLSISIPGIYETRRRARRDDDTAPRPPEAAPAAPAVGASVESDAASAPPPPPAGLAANSAVAAAPVPPSTPDDIPVVRPASDSPVGLWLTEKKEGRVRIEPCGDNLCGYEVDDQGNTGARKILIDMKPNGGKWAGRIRDPKGGGHYDSTIALSGPDRLRVQGCAFGGMFCGGQTWTRAD